MAGRSDSTKLRLRAYKLFARGWSRADVARELGIEWKTANRYHKKYLAKLSRTAQDNEDLFTRILENTLEELSILRDQERVLEATIENEQYEIATDEDGVEVSREPRPRDDQRPGVIIGAMAALQRNNEQRQRLKRLLDQRVEITTKVELARKNQNKILEFMSKNLCPDCAATLQDEFDKQFKEIAKEAADA